MFWLWCLLVFFFFKQKTAYEMRISDWSSDVCSSDLGSSEEHTRAERHAASGQRRHVLQERRMHPRFLVEQVAAVEEDFPGVAARGVGVPRQVRVDQRVSGRGVLELRHPVLLGGAHPSPRGAQRAAQNGTESCR